MANEDIKGTKSIKDYILSDEEVLKIKPKKKRPLLPAHANVRVLFQSGCDFGIEKKQGRTISQLIILVSKDQFYIKTGKTIVPLSLRRMKDFIRGIGENLDFGDQDESSHIPPIIRLDDVSWLDGIYTNETFIRDFVDILKTPVKTEMIRQNVMYLNDPNFNYDDLFMPETPKPDYSYLFEYSPALTKFILDHFAERRGLDRKQILKLVWDVRENIKEKNLLNNSAVFMVIEKAFGIEWAKKAVELYLESGIESNMSDKDLTALLTDTSKDPESVCSYYSDPCPKSVKALSGEIRKKISFSGSSFVDYLIKHSVSEGYAFDMDDFLKHWHDCLCGQLEIYGEIRDKYPENLESSYNRIKYWIRIHKEEIDQRNWLKAVDRMKSLEYTGDEYLIVCPKEMDELKKEGSALHNCVGRFTDNVCYGADMILFLRRKEDPEIPFVTIQVLPNKQITQIFGCCNSDPDKDVMEFIEKWAGEKELIMPSEKYGPRAPRHIGYYSFESEPFEPGGFGTGLFDEDGNVDFP